ncbi:hypothetical protein N7468_002885 [Penicillium chermesinum]|uniref:GroES-like protein n=1 Tax=Penicillium chermesinum TaxID=63820 RepID=A0A9W9PMI1_9EURO|nr:uncharacterized protein N7468_002885 [Penicillium chermesinum]KAJ5247902.1 hypothetical protein N7468_002885 [Penicillium chermesinum]KAJ6151660.1 hypothetical protein N7470_007257 [Penicillium chermesinum]
MFSDMKLFYINSRFSLYVGVSSGFSDDLQSNLVQCKRPHEQWEIVSLPFRDLGSTELLIRVHASGICNTDHFLMDGTWPGTQYPRVPGHEVIGRIAQIGSDLMKNPSKADRYAVGSLVGVGWNGGFCAQCECCRNGDFWSCTEVAYTGFSHDGGHAEYVYVPESAVIHIAEEALETATYAELAPLCCAGATVFGAILTSKWSPGDICAVQGVGGLGHLAIQIASNLEKVYAISSTSSKKALAISLGASGFIDSSKEDAVDYIRKLGGAKLIICTAPSSSQISAILPAISKNGMITLVAAATDGPIKVDNLLLNINRAALRGFACGCAQDTEKCISYATAKGIKAKVREFSLENFTEAYEDVMRNTANLRNVVVFP